MNRRQTHLYPPPAVRPAAAVRPQRRARRRTWFTPGRVLALILALGALALIAVPVLLLGGYYAYFQVTERIVPGVAVGDTHLGGMTVEEAATVLDVAWNQQRLLTLTGGAGSWTFAASDLGLTIDSLATAQQAYIVGHGQSPLDEARQMVQSMRSGWGIAPVVRFYPERARAALEALRSQTGRPPKDAALRVEDGNLVLVPAEVGYTINVDATVQSIASDPLTALLSGQVRVQLMPVIPSVEDHEIQAVMAEAENLLSRPVTLQAYDPVYDERIELPVPRQALASWLTVETGGDGLTLIGLDEERIREYLAGLDALEDGRHLELAAYDGSLANAVLQGRPLKLNVIHPPTTYTVQPGDTLIAIGWKVGIPYWMILQANPGLNPDALYAGQQLIIPSKNDLLPLPVVENKRIRISISEQRMWLYEDGQQIAVHVISTGIDRSPTQPGVFQVQTHELNAYASVWDLHMPHFLGIYEAWPGFMNGIHGLPTLSNGRRLWANVLGRPASYGCIILDLDDAEHLYHWAEDGVVVEILP